MEVERLCIRPDLVFVDGNHDYEFALFDIQCAARRLTPGGFIFIDDVAQVGPYFAAVDFLERHPDWIDCGCAPDTRDRTKAFDRSRRNIPGTQFKVLRAPSSYVLGERPLSFGDAAWSKPQVTGLRLSLDGQQKLRHASCAVHAAGLQQYGTRRGLCRNLPDHPSRHDRCGGHVREPCGAGRRVSPDTVPSPGSSGLARVLCASAPCRFQSSTPSIPGTLPAVLRASFSPTFCSEDTAHETRLSCRPRDSRRR